MEDLGKSFPASEGMVDAEEGTQQKHTNEFCLNCGTKLEDVFCHHCGQKDIPQRQTLGELWTNFISSFWSYEGKFFRTTKYLVTKPGFLAKEYSLGRRESYYHPARMYVFISFIFFLIFFSATDDVVELSDEDKVELENEAKEKLKNAKADSVLTTTADSTARSSQRKQGAFNFSFDGDGSDEYETIAEYDSIQNTKPESERDSWLERVIVYRGLKIKERYGDDTEKYGNEFGKAFMENFSKVLFFLLPFFALLLKLLYVRRDYYYSEHLVFSIYYYNFFYLAGSLQLLVQQVSWLAWSSTFIGFWIILYLLFAMKRMYAQGWGKTILKFMIFGFLFTIIMGIGFLINALAIFFLI